MTINVPNTGTSDSIGTGRSRQNEIAHALSNKVVTVDSNTTTGNAHVNGSVQVVTVHANAISGGTIAAPANVTITTNATFTSKVNLGAGANVMVTTGNATHRVLTVNASNSFSLTATKLTIAGDVSDVVLTSPANNDVLLYSNADSGFKNSPATVLTVGNAANAVYAANADKLDGLDATAFATNSHSHAFTDITGKPTTAQGYGLSEVNLGNSTVNSVSTNTSITVSNTLANSTQIATAFTVANSIVNTTHTAVGVTASNGTVASVVNNSMIQVSNATHVSYANTTGLGTGNSSISTSITQNSIVLANTTASITITRPDASQISAGNYFLGANGTWQTLSSGGGANLVAFTANGTWTKPAGLKAIKVTIVGGGGSCLAPNPSGIQGGSGAGGAAILILQAPAIPGPVSVTVGPAGAVTAPSVGGTSSFGGFASATGGAAVGAAIADGSAGGVGSGGTVNIAGGNGGVTGTIGPGSGVNMAWCGQGGNSIMGQGGPFLFEGETGSNPTPQNASPAIGAPGTGYGAGAAGKTSGAAPNTVGTQGIVLVEEFY